MAIKTLDSGAQLITLTTEQGKRFEVVVSKDIVIAESRHLLGTGNWFWREHGDELDQG